MGREPSGVQVEQKANGVAHDIVHVDPRVAGRNIEVKDYEVKECTEENLIIEKYEEKQEVLSTKSTNVDADEKYEKPRVDEYKKSSPIGSKSPGNMRGQCTVPQPFTLETEKRGLCTHIGVNSSPNMQSPCAKKNSQVTNVRNFLPISGLFFGCFTNSVLYSLNTLVVLPFDGTGPFLVPRLIRVPWLSENVFEF